MKHVSSTIKSFYSYFYPNEPLSQTDEKTNKTCKSIFQRIKDEFHARPLLTSAIIVGTALVALAAIGALATPPGWIATAVVVGAVAGALLYRHMQTSTLSPGELDKAADEFKINSLSKKPINERYYAMAQAAHLMKYEKKTIEEATNAITDYTFHEYEKKELEAFHDRLVDCPKNPHIRLMGFAKEQIDLNLNKKEAYNHSLNRIKAYEKGVNFQQKITQAESSRESIIQKVIRDLSRMDVEISLKDQPPKKLKDSIDANGKFIEQIPDIILYQLSQNLTRNIIDTILEDLGCHKKKGEPGRIFLSNVNDMPISIKASQLDLDNWSLTIKFYGKYTSPEFNNGKTPLQLIILDSKVNINIKDNKMDIKIITTPTA